MAAADQPALVYVRPQALPEELALPLQADQPQAVAPVPAQPRPQPVPAQPPRQPVLETAHRIASPTPRLAPAVNHVPAPSTCVHNPQAVAARQAVATTIAALPQEVVLAATAGHLPEAAQAATAEAVVAAAEAATAVEAAIAAAVDVAAEAEEDNQIYASLILK